MVDDAPADNNTMELVFGVDREHARLRYVREDRSGLPAAGNYWLREARGELIAYTNDDVRVRREHARAVAP